MSVIQDKISELRFIRRQNLEEEARVIGNYYRDIIRSYGIDCHYFKLNNTYGEEFTKTIDQNALFLHAYGYDVNPDYNISADMITYMEVENDIFNLNKYGVIPNTDVNFYFDTTDFACALAYKLGQYKEYKLYDTEISVKLNGLEAETMTIECPFATDILHGTIAIPLDSIELVLNEDIEMICDPTKISKIDLRFSANKDLYKSFAYKVFGDHPDDVFVNCKFIIKEIDAFFKNKLVRKVEDLLTVLAKYGYDVSKIKNFKDIIKGYNDRFNTNFTLHSKVGEVFDFAKQGINYLFVGKLNGSVLFHDLNQISKYQNMIHPDVGDIITIDFPDERNREQYEITEAVDKNLGNDGINPLLHKYVWKCRARRYINSQENFPEKNEANEQFAEKLDFINDAASNAGKAISVYEDNEDKVYGGYDKPIKNKDINAIDLSKEKPSIFLDETTSITIMEFGNGSKILTDGFDLSFKTSDGKKQIKIVTSKKIDKDKQYTDLPNDIQFIKATKDELVFINLENNSFRIVVEDDLKTDLKNRCLNSLLELTIPDNGAKNVNSNGENYFKFSNTNTILLSLGDSLICRFASGKIVKIA